jgi:biopolymer transport protein TolQ
MNPPAVTRVWNPDCRVKRACRARAVQTFSVREASIHSKQADAVLFFSSAGQRLRPLSYCFEKGAGLISFPVSALAAQISIWELVMGAKPIPMAVFGFLAVLSIVSWTIIFSKWNVFRRSRLANVQFLRMFRKAGAMDQVALASEQYKAAPLVAVFDFGYEEVDRQVKQRGTLTNKLSLERSLQLGISEEITKLERNMNWLATVATVSPFVGLFGTVVGIIDAFSALGTAGSASLRAVAPGISDALVATAAGLLAAIPAAIFYNHYGNVIKEIGTRMEDFALEFLNLAERHFED